MRDRDILSQSQAGQLCDWLELVDEVRLPFIAVLLLIVGILVLYLLVNYSVGIDRSLPVQPKLLILTS